MVEGGSVRIQHSSSPLERLSHRLDVSMYGAAFCRNLLEMENGWYGGDESCLSARVARRGIEDDRCVLVLACFSLAGDTCRCWQSTLTESRIRCAAIAGGRGKCISTTTPLGTADVLKTPNKATNNPVIVPLPNIHHSRLWKVSQRCYMLLPTVTKAPTQCRCAAIGSRPAYPRQCLSTEYNAAVQECLGVVRTGPQRTAVCSTAAARLRS